MKFSEQWLRQWVDPNMTTKELVEQLTMLGLEVDSVQEVAGDFTGVIIGEVLSVEQHPDAERLRCCKVNIGKNEILEIVCGGVNVRAGLRVPVAIVGARLPGDFKIKKAKLRGQPSNGMICSSHELGLGDGEKGFIMELRNEAPIGKDFREYLELNDTVIDVELTPNRGDCCSVRGIARDVAVANGLSITPHEIKSQSAVIQDKFPILLESPESCSHYVGRIIRNIRSEAVTPLWIEERLRRSGFRLIHPVVDVLNYVMLEIGQPMHAFDLDQLKENIVIRHAKKNEKIILLDEKEIELHEKNLIIADKKDPLALAGVMGGKHSGVTHSTRNIFLESAFFDPLVIRQSAKIVGVKSDSSYRFERGVDFKMQREAIERATELLLNMVGGEAGPVMECISEAHLPKEKTIRFSSKEINRLLGIEISDHDIEKILVALGMDIRKTEEGWIVVPPSYRFDIERAADLVEEIARIYGYDRIPAKPMVSKSVMLEKPEAYLTRSRIAHYLVDRGYFEAMTYSFISETMQTLFDPETNLLKLSNPMTNDMAVMRSTLWPGLMNAIQYNHYRQIPRVRLFETGLVFSRKKDGSCDQVPKLALVAAGDAYPEQWSAPRRPVDFYDLKGEIEALLEQTGAGSLFEWKPGKHPALHPGQTAHLYRQDQHVGCLGALHPQLIQQLELPPALYCFEVDLNALQWGELPTYQKISKFPSVRRDIAILVSQTVSAGEIRACITKKVGQLLTNIEIFDVYQGPNIEKDKKSVALGLTFQDPSRTLVDAEINEVIQDVVLTLERHFNAKLRA